MKNPRQASRYPNKFQAKLANKPELKNTELTFREMKTEGIKHVFTRRHKPDWNMVLEPPVVFFGPNLFCAFPFGCASKIHAANKEIADEVFQVLFIMRWIVSMLQA